VVAQAMRIRGLPVHAFGEGRQAMLKTIREWAFPVGMLLAWGVAAGYTLHALTTLQASLLPESDEPPGISTPVKPPAAEARLRAVPEGPAQRGM
jgi:hypothetical protein